MTPGNKTQTQVAKSSLRKQGTYWPRRPARVAVADPSGAARRGLRADVRGVDTAVASNQRKGHMAKIHGEERTRPGRGCGAAPASWKIALSVPALPGRVIAASKPDGACPNNRGPAG